MIQHTFEIDNHTQQLIHKSQWNTLNMMYNFHTLHFQVNKRAATFALLGDVDFTRKGDVAIWCILNTTSTSSQLLCIIKNLCHKDL